MMRRSRLPDKSMGNIKQRLFFWVFGERAAGSNSTKKHKRSRFWTSWTIIEPIGFAWWRHTNIILKKRTYRRLNNPKNWLFWIWPLIKIRWETLLALKRRWKELSVLFHPILLWKKIFTKLNFFVLVNMSCFFRRIRADRSQNEKHEDSENNQ